MKLFGFYIYRRDYKQEYKDLVMQKHRSWFNLIDANKGQAQEIERLERELSRYKRERKKDGRFVENTVQSEATAALKQYVHNIDASYDEVKKIAGFGE